MNAKEMIVWVLGIVILTSMPALAGENLVQTVADGCKAELETGCTPHITSLIAN